MRKEDFKILKKEILYQGYNHVERYTLQNRLFAGGWSRQYCRELVRRLDAVAVLPYDPKRDKVVLIEQFRIGYLERENYLPWNLEIVAGVKDHDHENAEEVVRREMQEEAGLEVLDLVSVFRYFSSPGVISEEIELFCAKVDSSLAPCFAGLAKENEDIRVHVIDSELAFSYLKTGAICNAMAIMALLWLQTNIVELKKKWG